MFNLLKKDVLTISKDRSELLILLVMPFVLISILGFALGGLMNNTSQLEAIPFAVVEMENNEEEKTEIVDQLASTGLDEATIDAIVSGVDVNQAINQMLIELENEALLNVEYMNAEAAAAALVEEEVRGVLTIPAALTSQIVRKQVTDQAITQALTLRVHDETTIQADVLKQIFKRFVSEYNLMLSIQNVRGESVVIPDQTEYGATVSVETTTPVSAFQYYTIGMAMMFSLYVASSLSSNAFKEKKTDVLMRMMLAGEKPMRYLLSKAISGYVLVFLQLLILVLLSTVLFDSFPNQSVSFWLTMTWMTLVYAVVIGALTALLTSLTLMMSRDSVSGIFSGLVVTLFAFLGGSFTQVEQISPFIRTLGNWTPNGAMMTVYLQQIQGYGLDVSAPLLIRILIMSVVIFVLAVVSFPKRRLS
ncbi:ABC-2 type transport system permease protein [Streptohalobacillus salinus]|uniref:ABC-2 type transport system permease protein n=1 Tax=Streptohalobacillus salinus TaxID=621096 RepID=A0A2V3WA02_9BACI|nr:ABC transporter permease [Streptohalobacillus salinus]PXW90900.1 ABC-2 type transport system permease protein [Streptohalobacillus salinus]